MHLEMKDLIIVMQIFPKPILFAKKNLKYIVGELLKVGNWVT